MSILDELQQADREVEQSKQTAEKAKADRQAIRERIRNGESTGDPAMDLAISVLGTLDPKVVGRFRRLTQDVRPGRLILISDKEEQYHGCTGFGQPREDMNYTVEHQLTLAVCAGKPKVSASIDQVSIPVKKSVRYRFYNRKQEATDKPIILVWPELQRFGMNVQMSYHNSLSNPQRTWDVNAEPLPDPEFDVRVGRPTIREWAHDQGLLLGNRFRCEVEEEAKALELLKAMAKEIGQRL